MSFIFELLFKFQFLGFLIQNLCFGTNLLLIKFFAIILYLAF